MASVNSSTNALVTKKKKRRKVEQFNVTYIQSGFSKGVPRMVHVFDRAAVRLVSAGWSFLPRSLEKDCVCHTGHCTRLEANLGCEITDGL